MAKLCCHGGAGLIAALVVGITCLLVICGPLVESLLLSLDSYHGCSLIDSIKERNISKVCAMLYAIQSVYFVLVCCMIFISILMCNGSLMCDLMLESCREEPEEEASVPVLRFRDDDGSIMATS